MYTCTCGEYYKQSVKTDYVKNLCIVVYLWWKPHIKHHSYGILLFSAIHRCVGVMVTRVNLPLAKKGSLNFLELTCLYNIIIINCSDKVIIIIIISFCFQFGFNSLPSCYSTTMYMCKKEAHRMRTSPWWYWTNDIDSLVDGLSFPCIHMGGVD